MAIKKNKAGRPTNKTKGLPAKITTTTVALPAHKKVLVNAYGSMANAIETLAVYTIHNDNLPLVTN